MNKKSLAFVVGGLTLASLILVCWTRPASGQPSMSPSAVGRYQISVLPGAGLSSQICVVDTATGRCWSKMMVAGSEWIDAGSPVMKSDR